MKSEPEIADGEEKEDVALKALLKRALVADDARPDAAPTGSRAKHGDAELLANVQRKLRKRSKGKFYGDGWSTTPSQLNYALIAAVMLVVIAAVYLALGPTGISSR